MDAVASIHSDPRASDHWISSCRGAHPNEHHEVDPGMLIARTQNLAQDLLRMQFLQLPFKIKSHIFISIKNKFLAKRRTLKTSLNLLNLLLMSSYDCRPNRQLSQESAPFTAVWQTVLGKSTWVR